MSDLSEAMHKLAMEIEANFRDPDLPNFCDEDTVQAVADIETAKPIADLLNARNWWLADKDRRGEAFQMMMEAIADLENGLLSRWRDL